MYLKCTILVIQAFYLARGADILAIMPTPSYSHQVAFFDLWNQLSLRGHKVTLITTNPQKNEMLTNLTEIDLSWTYKHFQNISNVAERVITMWNMHLSINERAYKISEEQLSYPSVQELIHNRNRKFDVLLLETFFPEFLGFAEIYNCPTILIASLDTMGIYHHKVGNTAHPVLYPELGALFQHPLDFKERVTSTIYSVYVSLFYNYINFPKKNQLLKKFFNVTATTKELLDKIDMLFLNVNPILHPIRAVGPSTITIGGLRQIIAEPLPEDLAKFLDNATNGFIYFSLGGNIKSKDLQKESLKAVAEALSELPYKVLWKFEADADAMPYKAENVKLIKWAPQVSILAHPNMKAFVTQGGLQSMEEAINSEVPCVVIPFVGDQQQNARLMRNKGFAVTVGRHPHIKKEDLKNAISEVINNPKYKYAIKQVKKLISDIPLSSLEKAIWWTEYVIRNKGAKHLRNPAADLPLYQYYLLDVIAFLIITTFVIIFMLIYLLKKFYCLGKVCYLSRSHSVRKKHNKKSQ